MTFRRAASLACALAALVLPLAETESHADRRAPESVTARLEWEPGGLGGYNSSNLELSLEAPAGVKLPVGLLQPRFARRELFGGAALSFVLDVGAGAERIWVDHDLDGDVTDDRFGRWETVNGTSHGRADTVLVPLPGERQPVPVEIQIQQNGSPPTAYCYLKVYRQGEVEIAGRLRTVALRDGNNDLRFDDPATDWVFLDVDGDGRLETSTTAHEALHNGAVVRIADRGYTINVTDPTGAAVEFTETAEPPPARPRRWKPQGVLSSDYRPAPPSETLEELTERFREERDAKKPYAERYSTVDLIGRVGTESSFRLLDQIARDDDDANLRGAAVRGMGNAAYLECGGKRVAELTRDKDANLASAAIQSLHRMGHPDRERIYRDLLDSSNATVLGAAAKHLAYVDSDAARAAVVKACRAASQDAARYQAYQGARAFPDGPPDDLVEEMAASDYASLAAMAIEDLFAKDHPRTRELTLAAAREAKRPVQISLGKALVAVLGAFGDGECTEFLLELAEDAPAQLQTDLLQQLSRLRGQDAVSAFKDALDAKSAAVRTLAAQILAGIRRSDVTEALQKRFKKEKDDEAALAEIDALGDLGDAAAVDLLLKTAKKKGLRRAAAVRALARIGFGLPNVREFLLKMLDSKDFEERILAVDAAGTSGDEDVARKLLPNLDHEAWQVRLAVAEALRHVRVRDWVEPLIVRLEKEEESRVRAAIGQTLFELTGARLYDVASAWRLWFTDHGATFEVPDALPTLPKVAAGQTQGGFYGIPVDSDNVCFVIDQSGSMSAVVPGADAGEKPINRLDQAAAEVVRAVDALGPRARVNVIFFHTTVHPWKDGLTKLTSGQRKALKDHVLGQRPTGGTNLYDGLELALSDPDVDTVMLLSDGVPGAGRYVATDDILRAVKRLNQTRRIAIHCVSLGRDSELMERLAKENGGVYVRR